MQKTKGTILVTGGAGYIGSVLVRQLLDAGYHVRVADILKFGGHSLASIENHANFEFFNVDIRSKEVMRPLVSGCHAVAHLAAIVGDPACKAEPDLARSVNLDASIQLYTIANEEGCQRFIFASTCSNYGKMPDPEAYVTEDSPLAPVSLYAETKVATETYLLSQPRTNTCKPTCLRFSTVYGISPRMRFDLTVNEFTKELKMGRELLIFGEEFWRPYCHVSDLARSVLVALQATEGNVAFEVFNVGDTAENYTKRMLVEQIAARIPHATVKYVKKEEDPRDYKVNFDKIARTLNYRISKRIGDGITEVIDELESGAIANPDDTAYVNVH